jgi:ubiquinone/menaquinone biosynthesis C-methylase UbiE
VQKYAEARQSERMSNASFRFMALTFKVTDLFFPYIDKRVATFGIREGMTVVDYGCGTGRYTLRFASLVGPAGIVYAADIHELAIEAVKKEIARRRLQNVVPVLAHGYQSGIPDGVADIVCAIDMFFGIREPAEFLAELRRVCKPDGTLIIDDGHQPRQATKEKIALSSHWRIAEELRDHLKCRPV